ncbi:hypothetical protein [Shimia biformata]|nr:hypothetical protein [Shimia biformata]
MFDMRFLHGWAELKRLETKVIPAVSLLPELEPKSVVFDLFRGQVQ